MFFRVNLTDRFVGTGFQTSRMEFDLSRGGGGERVLMYNVKPFDNQVLVCRNFKTLDGPSPGKAQPGTLMLYNF